MHAPPWARVTAGRLTTPAICNPHAIFCIPYFVFYILCFIRPGDSRPPRYMIRMLYFVFRILYSISCVLYGRATHVTRQDPARGAALNSLQSRCPAAARRLPPRADWAGAGGNRDRDCQAPVTESESLALRVESSALSVTVRVTARVTVQVTSPGLRDFVNRGSLRLPVSHCS
jgi:hypothetical protein